MEDENYITIREACFVYSDLSLSTKTKKKIIERKLEKIDNEKFPGKKLISWTKLNNDKKNQDIALDILNCLFDNNNKSRIDELINISVEYDMHNKKCGSIINNILLNSVYCDWLDVLDFFLRNNFIDFTRKNYICNMDFFQFCCQFGNENTVLKLLDYGIDFIDFNYLNDKNENGFIIACRNQYSYVAIRILSKINDINHCSFNKDTALHYISFGGLNDIFNTIKDYENIDFNVENKDGNTPLILAAKKNNIYIIYELLKKNINLLHQNDYGYTVLHYAIYLENTQLIYHLIDLEPRLIFTFKQNKKRNKKSEKEELNIFTLVIYRSLFDVLNKMMDYIDLMDEEFINFKDKDGYTVFESLILSKRKINNIIIKLLNTKKCLTFYPTINKETESNAFVFACDTHNEEIAIKILEYRIDNNLEIDDYLLDKEFAYCCSKQLYKTAKFYVQNKRIQFKIDLSSIDIKDKLFDIIVKNNWEDIAIEFVDRIDSNESFFYLNDNYDTILTYICKFNMEKLFLKICNKIPLNFANNKIFNDWNKHLLDCIKILKSDKNKNILNILNSKLYCILQNEKQRLLLEKKSIEENKDNIHRMESELILNFEKNKKNKKKKSKNNNNNNNKQAIIVDNNSSTSDINDSIIIIKDNYDINHDINQDIIPSNNIIHLTDLNKSNEYNKLKQEIEYEFSKYKDKKIVEDWYFELTKLNIDGFIWN